jgi:DNA-binding MarR family transcriptional regulator
MANIVHGLRHKGDEPHLLREIVRVHQMLPDVFSRQVVMPSSRLELMRLLAAHCCENIGIMDIARYLGVNAAAVTRQVKEMESGGLVDRVSDARDGRRSYVRLRPEGLRTFEQIHERAHEREREIGSIINSEDIATAVRVLSQLREALENLR